MIGSGGPWKPRRSGSLTVSLSLWTVDRLKRWIELAGVDFPAFRLLLELRTRMAAEGKLGGQPGAVTVCTAIVLAGLVVGLASVGACVAALATHKATWWLWIGQSMWLLMLASMCVNHFVIAMLDPADVGVLLGRPISGRTILATRFAQVLVPTGLLGICALFAPTLTGVFVLEPLAALVAFPVATMSSGLLVVSAMTLAVALALRIAGPAKFQRVTFWLQIGGAISVGVLPQIANRLISLTRVKEFYASHDWLAWFVPVEHGLALYNLLAGDTSARTLGLATLGLVLPPLVAVLAFRLLRNDFVAALGDRGELVSARSTRFGTSLFQRLAPFLCRSNEARAAFGFTLALSRRERPYLRVVLPMVLMSLVISFVVAMPHRAGEGSLDAASYAGYSLAMTCGFVFSAARYSEHHEARWCFDALPFRDWRAVLEGGTKALFVGTILPIVALSASVSTCVFASVTWRDGLLSFTALAACLCHLGAMLGRKLPFATEPKKLHSFRDIAGVFTMFGMLAVLIGLHWLSRQHLAAWATILVGWILVLAFGWRKLTRLEPEFN
ncbi:MAG: hypothetical protein NTV21_03675 [Planctomycetota bacterium]|nr:hypothetical protein [Planctomycetota bacterium]